jgi:hypothetical protein
MFKKFNNNFNLLDNNIVSHVYHLFGRIGEMKQQLIILNFYSIGLKIRSKYPKIHKEFSLTDQNILFYLYNNSTLNLRIFQFK